MGLSNGRWTGRIPPFTVTLNRVFIHWMGLADPTSMFREAKEVDSQTSHATRAHFPFLHFRFHFFYVSCFLIKSQPLLSLFFPRLSFGAAVGAYGIRFGEVAQHIPILYGNLPHR